MNHLDIGSGSENDPSILISYELRTQERNVIYLRLEARMRMESMVKGRGSQCTSPIVAVSFGYHFIVRRSNSENRREIGRGVR